MEIRNRPTGDADRPRNATEGNVIDFTRVNRERIADAVEDLEATRLEKLRHPPADVTALRGDEKQAAGKTEDRVDVSVASKALAADEDPTEVARRRAQIDTVRNAVAEGSLATPERIERAVRKLLG